MQRALGYELQLQPENDDAIHGSWDWVCGAWTANRSSAADVSEGRGWPFVDVEAETEEGQASFEFSPSAPHPREDRDAPDTWREPRPAEGGTLRARERSGEAAHGEAPADDQTTLSWGLAQLVLLRNL